MLPLPLTVYLQDFVSPTGAVTSRLQPTYGTAGQIPNPAVIFNVTGGFAQYLIANSGLPALAGIYGGSDWSFEAW